MSGTTTNYGFVKPDDGDALGGTTTNANMDAIDTALAAVAAKVTGTQKITVLDPQVGSGYPASNPVSSVDWTEVDLTAVTSATATWVALLLTINDTGGAGAYIQVRKNAGAGAPSTCRAQVANVTNNMSVAYLVMQAGQKIEVKIVATGAGTATANVYVVAYGEPNA